jgi:hypothetical protein
VSGRGRAGWSAAALVRLAERSRAWRVLAGIVVIGGLAATAALATTRIAGEDSGQELRPNTPYDGRFTFVRISYEHQGSLRRFGGGGYNREGCWGGDPPWMHDYPCAESNLANILRELTLIRPYMNGSNVLALDDPELFKFPVAYMSEPGFWQPTAAQAAGLRAYLLKGGFIIFDDFRGPQHWRAMEAAFRLAMPDAEFVRLDGSEPIFNTFFEIESLENAVPSYGGARPEWWGVYENNDRSRRLIAVASYNNDLGDYWEYSGQGFYPIDLTNEAYKLGVNYMIYGMTR